MTFYPQMFALLDIERTIQGLKAWEGQNPFDPTPEPDSVLLTGNCYVHRKRRLSELADALPADLIWMHDVPDPPDAWREERQVVALIEEGKPGPHYSMGSWLRLSSRFQHAILPDHRRRRVLAQIDFDGENHVMALATDDQPYQAILNLLSAIQPVHAFVTSEWTDPSEEPDTIMRALRHPYASAFFGPELTRRIPKHLFNPANGFSHIERIGEGMWITFEGVGLRSTETDEEFDLSERQYAACNQIANFLKTLPDGGLD